MSERKMICPRCGAEMNHHAMKIDYSVDDPAPLDETSGGALKRSMPVPIAVELNCDLRRRRTICYNASVNPYPSDLLVEINLPENLRPQEHPLLIVLNCFSKECGNFAITLALISEGSKP